MSVDALHDNEMVVALTPATARLAGCEGGVESPGGGEVGHVEVVALSEAAGDEFLAASRAITANAYDVPHESPIWLDDVPGTDATFALPR